MNKHCVLVGCGSKFGAYMTKCFIDQGYQITLVTSHAQLWKNIKDVNVISVDWKTLAISDLKRLLPASDHVHAVIFNQNSSALSAEKFMPNQMQNPKHWQQSYFVACQFPYFYIQLLNKKLTQDSKIIWMLSQLIQAPMIDHIGFADYVGNKFTNACVMKSFSLKHPSCFFAVFPEGGTQHDARIKAQGITALAMTQDRERLNGKIFDSQGQELDFFHA